jgi:hypothetical protein
MVVVLVLGCLRELIAEKAAKWVRTCLPWGAAVAPSNGSSRCCGDRRSSKKKTLLRDQERDLAIRSQALGSLLMEPCVFLY